MNETIVLEKRVDDGTGAETGNGAETGGWAPVVPSKDGIPVLGAAAFALLAVGVFAFAILVGGKAPEGTPGRFLYGFFFERSPIQWVTLTVFLFALGIVFDRLLRLRALRREVRDLLEQLPAALAGCRPPTGLSWREGTGIVERRVREIRAMWQSGGWAVARAWQRELAARDEGAMERVYQTLGSLVTVMLALGFFGTVLGISASLFASYGMLAELDIETLKEGLQTFTGGLGTALDTTVLAMLLAIVLTVLTTVVHGREAAELRSLDQALDDYLARGQAAEESASQVHRLLRGMHDSLAGLSPARFTAATRQLEASLTLVVQETGELLHRRVGEVLDAAAEKMGRAVADQLRDSFERVARRLDRLPEIEIRYPPVSDEGGTSLEKKRR